MADNQPKARQVYKIIAYNGVFGDTCFRNGIKAVACSPRGFISGGCLSCSGQSLNQLRQRYEILDFNIIFIKTCGFPNSSYLCRKEEEMRIVSHKRLKDFYSQPGREDARIPLERWYSVAEDASWQGLSDIRRDFAATDYVGNQHYVFNIGGNKYRLVVVAKFMMGYLFIRFVGTHQEYDNIDASTI